MQNFQNLLDKALKLHKDNEIKNNLKRSLKTLHYTIVKNLQKI